MDIGGSSAIAAVAAVAFCVNFWRSSLNEKGGEEFAPFVRVQVKDTLISPCPTPKPRVMQWLVSP
ncbi:hypothetical protein BH11PSE11_BH11PSE11_33380 [soil metagenome]